MIALKLIRKFNTHAVFIIFYMILLLLALFPYYINGTVILGGEGDYVLDFSIHLRKFSFTWFPSYSVGIQNMGPSGTGLNIVLLWLIEKLTGSIAITNFVLIFLIYFLPFLAMYLVSKEIKSTPFISFISSLFYVVNPFMLYYLNCLNQWNVFSVVVMPLFLWVILKYYHNNFKLFLFFGFISACFSFAYTNPPLLLIILTSIILSMAIASYYHNKKLILSHIFKKYCIVLISFILFNLWWILCFLPNGTISTAKEMFSRAWARSWLDTTVGGHGAIIAKMFSLTTIIGDNPYYDFFTYWYNTIFGKLITLVPILIVVYFILIVKDKKMRNTFHYAMLLVLLIVLFFVKGNSGLFGFIYNFMFSYVPFFYIFKTPVEKFGLFYVFILSVLLLFIITGINSQKHYKLSMGIFIIYLIFCSMPIITGNIIPDFKIGNLGYCSRKYRDKQKYEQFRKEVNSDNFQYRLLSLPGVGNYQVLIPNYNNRFYTGLDPVLMNTNKPFIATQNHIDLLYENITSEKYKKLLGIYNIGKVIINEDLIPWFGIIGIDSVPELKKTFNKIMSSKRWGSITLYENKNDFLPQIYSSNSQD